MAKRKNYSFLKGCGKVCKEHYSQLNSDLKEYLGCKSDQYYYLKRKRYIDMPEHIKKDIEEIFSKYGVEPDDVWIITDVEDGKRN
ncbi:MAG: hypothetical protein RSO15_09845 [Bacteroides sp.]|uniref:hypothetical protein n=1 Tax=Bacteroides sp. TaxID=29523 RepID=UPI002FC9719D